MERASVAHNRKPIIAITMGDPAGVGPEIIARANASASVHRFCRPIVLGSPKILQRAVRLCDLNMRVQEVSTVHETFPSRRLMTVINCVQGKQLSARPGIPTQISGQMAIETLQAATKLALSDQVSAVTTAPISKLAIAQAGFPYPGHTELFAKLTKTKEFAMLMLAPVKGVSENTSSYLKILLVTTHVPIKRLSSQITNTRVCQAIRLAHQSCRKYFGIPRPKIAVASLNPHAGEGGTLGMEEKTVIQPAIAKMRKTGLRVYGAFAPDTLMVSMIRSEFDIAVAMYHEQALIPIKLLSFGHAINLTVGIPFIRTSVDHGTAYDIAWKGKADPSSLIGAIRLAASLSNRVSHGPA